MRTTAGVLLLLATLFTGLMAGLYAAFSYAVMPGLRRSDDRSFVEAVRGINVAIINPLFLSLFMGALLIGAGAVFALWRSQSSGLVWAIAGLALYVVTVAITAIVNVPLNDELANAGSLETIDASAVREKFYGNWVAGNLARAVFGIAAFASFCWALLQHSPAK